LGTLSVAAGLCRNKESDAARVVQAAVTPRSTDAAFLRGEYLLLRGCRVQTPSLLLQLFTGKFEALCNLKGFAVYEVKPRSRAKLIKSRKLLQHHLPWLKNLLVSQGETLCQAVVPVWIFLLLLLRESGMSCHHQPTLFW